MGKQSWMDVREGISSYTVIPIFLPIPLIALPSIMRVQWSSLFLAVLLFSCSMFFFGKRASAAHRGRIPLTHLPAAT